MLNRIIAFSLKNKLIIVLFTIALIVYGVFELTRLPIDAVPDITNNQVQVITVSPALGAPDIERLITFPIEQAGSNIAGLREIRSFSRFGLSVVTIVFNDNTDIYWARQQVTERLRLVEIPPEFGIPQLGPVTTGLGEIYQYTVRPREGYEDKYSLADLRTIQDWVIKRQLLGVKGVADVASFGGELKQYEIAVDPARLKANNITINDVLEAVKNNNENTGGAYIDKGPSALFIRSVGLVTNMDDILQIVVKGLPGGMPLLIRDVATVQPGHATRYGMMTYNGRPADNANRKPDNAGGKPGNADVQPGNASGKPDDKHFTGLREVSGAVVMMLKGANSHEVVGRIKERIALIQKTLPEGIIIDPFLDRTKMVDHAIGTVEKNLLEGALIVVFVLVVFLGNLRAGLLVASIIPLSMLFAIIMMNLFGVSGNLMSLGALDFGLIVDGAVIIVEAVLHRFRPGEARLSGLVMPEGSAGAVVRERQGQGENLEQVEGHDQPMSHNQSDSKVQRMSQGQMDDAVGKASGRMMNSAVFGQIIILVVYLPILTLQGIEGKMFKPMAQTVAFALLGAFLLSLTYIPMMSSLILSKKIGGKASLSDRLMGRLEKGFRHVLRRAFKIPIPILGSIGVLFLVSIWLLTRMGGQFIPTLEEGDFAVETRVLTGSNLQTSFDALSKASGILLSKFPEIEKIAGKTGSSEIPTDPMPMDASDMIIVLKNKDQWVSARSFPELEAKMLKELNALPGVTFGFQYPVQMRFNELMTGARQDIVCKIFGENMDTLARYARALGEILNTVKGSSGLYIEAVTGMRQIVIDYDRTALAQYGVSVADINKVVNTAFAGRSTGLVYEGEKRFDLVVRLAGDQRKKLEDVEDLLIPASGGIQIPLRALARVAIQEGPNQIQREDAQRRIMVGCNVRGRDIQSMVSELQQKVDSGIHLPPGYFIRYGGAFENLVAAKDRLMIAVPVSLLLIFLLLYFAFHSIRQGLLIYTAIPLSASGGIIALAVRDMPFSISAGIGFIALFGVAVLNGIVLISEYNRNRFRIGQEGTDWKAIVLEGTVSRLRPVLMTATVASMGFLPMAISNGAGAEVQRPLATVVIGGLVIATFLTLFVLPILSVMTEGRGKAGGSGASPAMMIILLLMTGLSVHGQRTITLAAAIDTAMAKNLSLRSEKLNAAYQEEIKHTAYSIPQTSASFEYGQINSAYTDNKWVISQSIRFPTVYSAERSVYEQQWKGSLLNIAIRQRELKRQVSQVYYNLVYLQRKAGLLLRSDSIFKEFMRLATLRFEKGETDILEKTTAVSQAGQITLQKEMLAHDLAILKEEFRWLLHSDIELVPDPGDTRLPPIKDKDPLGQGLHLPGDSFALVRHPFLLELAQQQKLSAARLRLEKSRLAPDLFAAYNNSSMRGDGADGKSYSSSARFQSFQLGVGIPLFFGSQRSAIAAGKLGIRLSENNYQVGLQSMQVKYRQAELQYRKCLTAVTYFESSGINNADTILLTADRKFRNGAINYLEWVMLANNAIAMESEYIDALKNYNYSVIELDYLTGNGSEKIKQ